MLNYVGFHIAIMIDIKKRGSYCGKLTFVDGHPRNPIGRTGMIGRGLLGKWGPNYAADPLVTRFDPDTGKLQMVAVERSDTHDWAIPGGMVEGKFLINFHFQEPH